MKSELDDYKAALKVTEDPTAAAVLVLAERVNKLGFDTNVGGQGASEYIGSRLDHVVAALRGIASALENVGL